MDNPIQFKRWEDGESPSPEVARVTGDGRLQVGDTSLMTTDESLVEAHEQGTSSATIKRGVNTFGKFTGAISNGIAWLVSELQLPGLGTISGIHTALRAKLTHDNDTNDSSGADLRAG
ncbi:MAG: hypothetical protein Q9P01_12260 [Anaerolineae bacterium]|nr:hypothetical protein [Anaerolineae bacterium]